MQSVVLGGDAAGMHVPGGAGRDSAVARAQRRMRALERENEQLKKRLSLVNAEKEGKGEGEEGVGASDGADFTPALKLSSSSPCLRE
jgi:hypothetical protein